MKLQCHAILPLFTPTWLGKKWSENIHSSLTQASVPSTCKLICHACKNSHERAERAILAKNMVPISHLGTNLTSKCPAVWRHAMFASAISLNVVLLGRNRVPIRAATSNYFCCRLVYPLFFNYSISRDYLLYFHQPILDFCLT